MKAGKLATRAFAVTLTIGLLAALLIPFATRSLQAAASGITYYVSPSGSDLNSGTVSGSPFKTIQKAVDIAQPGDLVLLGPGDYLQDIISRRSGTAGAPITIQGPSTAVVKGGGRARIVEINHDYLTIDGFTIDGLWGAADSMSGYRDKLLYAIGKAPLDGVVGLRLLNMTFKNAGGECVRLRYFAQNNEVAFSTFVGCGVHDFRFNAGGKNGEAIYIGTAPEQLADGKNPTTDPDRSNNNWIHNNRFDTRGNECVDIKEAASGNIVEHNSCTGQRDPESGGFDARGSGNVFRHNESFGNRGAGIRLGGDTADQGTNNDIYGNSIHDNQAGGVKFQRTPQGNICGNITANNIGGDSVGTYGSQFSLTVPCSAPTATGTATPVPTKTATPVPTKTATPIPTRTATPVPTGTPPIQTCSRFYAVSGSTANFIEAELYSRLSGRFVEVADNNRSGGRYMQIPGAGMMEDLNTYLTFDLSVSSGGTFYVWVLGTGPSSNADSFWLQADSATPIQVSLPQGAWGWKKAGTTMTIGNGAHTFKVKNREDGSSIDKIMLTKDQRFTPSGLGGAALTPQCK